MAGTATPTDLVASGKDHNASHGTDVQKLWYSDPTGEQVVRQLLAVGRTDYFVTNEAGDEIFRISGKVLRSLLFLFRFTKSRRGRSIRAHLAPGISS